MRTRLPWLLWLIWLGISGWIVAFRTPIATDLTYFLPRNASVLDAILVHQMRAGPASRLLMIALEGGDESSRAGTSRELATRLRSNLLFESVLNGADAQVYADLEQRLFPYRYVLSPALQPGHFDPPALRAALQARLTELASPAGVLQGLWLTRDPTSTWIALLRDWLTVEGPVLRHGVWFSRDGTRALLLARTRASGFDLDGQARALEAVQSAFAQTVGCAEERSASIASATSFEGGASCEASRTSAAVVPASPIHLNLGGPGVLSVEANSLITSDAIRLSVINSLLVAALLLVVYRSLRVLGLGLIPLATGVLSGMAATSLAFGGVHGITLGFGATLIGVAADYPNHLFTHLSPRETPAHAMNRIWPTLRLGLLTNVASFGAMLFSGFPGLAQLAVFAGSGLLAAGFATRWVLPYLSGTHLRLPAWVERGLPVRQQAAIGVMAVRPSSAVRGLRATRWLPLGVTMILFVTQIVSGRSLWNDDIGALNPVPAQRQALDATLQRDFGATHLGRLVVITASDEEAALSLSESLVPTLDDLRRQGALVGYDLAARYLPSRQAQERRLALLPDRDTLARNLDQAGRGLPFREQAFVPFLDEAEAARQRGHLNREYLTGTWLGDRVDSLLVALPTGWAALVTLGGIQDDAAIQRALEPWQDQGVRFVDLKTEASRLLRDYREEAIRLLAASLLLILSLLALGLRGFWPAIAVLLPVLAASASTALIMALTFDGLNLYHLVSLLLVMGLSLDQALFFNRDAADPEERRRTLLSLLVCGLSSVLAFGTLATSAINMLRAIGATVALGAVLAIVFAALLAQKPAHAG